MQMLYLLPAVGPHVSYRPITRVLYARLLGRFDDELQQRVTAPARPFGQFVQGGHMLARYHQNMLRGFRMQVMKGDEIRVLKDEGGAELPPSNPTEDAVVHGR